MEKLNDTNEIFKELEISTEFQENAFYQIFHKVNKILKEEIGVVKELDLQSNLENDLSLDSVSMMELVLSIEHEYGIEVADEDVVLLKNIGDVIAYIYKKIENE